MIWNYLLSLSLVFFAVSYYSQHHEDISKLSQLVLKAVSSSTMRQRLSKSAIRSPQQPLMRYRPTGRV